MLMKRNEGSKEQWSSLAGLSRDCDILNTFLCIKKELRISGEVVDAGGEKSDVSIEKYGSKARLRTRRIKYVLLGHKNKVRPPVFL